MKKMTLGAMTVILFAHAGAAAAAEGDAIPNPSDAPPAKVTEAVSPKSLNAREVPKLVIRWQCGDCPVNDKVPPLIEQAYVQEAGKNGYTVSETDTAEMSITEFTQRPPAKRALLGVFAGKDKLGVQVVYRSNTRQADDYSANAWFGMNSLCESVAQKSLKEILSIAHPEKPGASD